MSEHAKANLQRLMAAAGLSIHQVAERSGVDERTVRAILGGGNRPHARTLHRLAEGLGVPVDELFLDPSQLLYRRFDRQTNPVIDQLVELHPEMFEGWGEADFDELHTHVGTGGALTFEGALATVRRINRSRQLHRRLEVLLESSQAETIEGVINLLYDQVVVKTL
jgi:transcriptional regulator with XRE-family HTH domain